MAMDRPDLTADDVALQAARTLTRVSAGAGHELANRLGAVRAFGAVLRLDEHVVGEYGIATVDAVRGAGDEAMQLVQALLGLVRSRPPAPVPVRPAAAVASAIRLVAADARGGLALVVDVAEDLPEVEADPARLHQALVALLVNALDALGHPHAAGRLGITAGVRPGVAGARDAVEVRVADDAPPVPALDVAHLFDRRPPSGTTARAGLDLAVARHLVGQDGGSLRYEPDADGRNVLVLALPVLSPAAADAPVAPGDEPAPSGPGDRPIAVLVCDDDPAVRNIVGRLLARAGIASVPARSGEDALALLAGGGIDVVLADNLMAGMRGPELHAAVAARHPGLAGRFVLVSGDPEDAELVAFSRGAGLRVLPKPFDATALVAAVREASRA